MYSYHHADTISGEIPIFLNQNLSSDPRCKILVMSLPLTECFANTMPNKIKVWSKEYAQNSKGTQ